MHVIGKVAGIAAAAALIVYGLSCRPSWSPDSTKVAFVYSAGPETGCVGVFDVTSGTVSPVLAFAEECEIGYPVTVWHGERLVIVAGTDNKDSENRLLVLVIDPASRAFHSIRSVDAGEFKIAGAVPVVLDATGSLWLSSGDREPCLIKIAAGAHVARPVAGPGSVLLAEAGGRIFYLGEAEEQDFAGTLCTVKEREGPAKGLVAGLFDPEAEEFQPIATFAGVENAIPFAVSPDGEKACVCFPDSGEGQRDRLFLIDREGQAAPAEIALPEEVARVCGFAFGADSTALWIVNLKPAEGEAAPEVELAELDFEKGILRRATLPFDGVQIEEDLGVALQPAISPDGKRLALCTTCFEKEAPGRLLLVDLESETLKVKVVTPGAAEAVGAAEK